MGAQGGDLAVRVIPRGADCQIRLQFHPTLGEAGALEIRLHRKSPSEEASADAFLPTSAGLVIPREQLQEFAAVLGEIIAELDR